MAPRPTIAYFVHDLHDAAVERRVVMLSAGGGDVVVIGFRRRDDAPESIAGAAVVDLGRTGDGRLAQRAKMVIANLVRPARILAAAAGAEIVIGRNLEALALAARVRRATPGSRLVYECLDIHRTLVGESIAARAIQRVEAGLLRAVDVLIVSSPAFVREHFAHRPTLCAMVAVVENKVVTPTKRLSAPVPRPAGPPWTIGWFGNLRCRRTLTVLSALAARLEGRVEVLIAGRPSPAEFDDFEGAVARAPHCRFLGPYRPDDLGGLYARCHFAWAIDYFEQGLNSSWLLPNRLYEASVFGAVPIALHGVETGRWLAAYGAGVLLDNGDALAQLEALFATLDEAHYESLGAAIAAIPRDALIADERDCRALMAVMTGTR